MIYFDNAATTIVAPEVQKTVNAYMVEEYANPSAMHRAGLEVEKKLRNAQKFIAKSLGTDVNNIIYTSGATESNNTAILSVASNCSEKSHFITTKIEHPSVLAVYQYLEQLGHKITYLNVDNNGIISIDELIRSVRANTKLISIIYVNNEIGSIQPMNEIVNSLKKSQYAGEIHIDATQFLGKFEIDLKKLDIDYLTASGHKLHAPKGIGILYCKNIKRLKPLMYGGAQQNNKRSGTLNTSGIIGFAKALSISDENRKSNFTKILNFRKRLIDYCDRNKQYCRLIGADSLNFSPYINSIQFYNIGSEIMLHSLENYDIMVASGSACSTKNTNLSHVLSSLSENDFKNGAIRISFSDFNQDSELDRLFEVLDIIIPELERYTNVKR